MSTNFLSGSSIDNLTHNLFNAFNSNNCYIGFSRGNNETQWGINALLQIDPIGFPNNIINTSIETFDNLKFNDINSLKYVDTNLSRTVYIRKYANTDTSHQSPIDFGNIGDNIKLVYMNNDWALITGLSYDYHYFMEYSTSASYYITNSDSSIVVKISEKSLSNIPFHIVDCNLYMKFNGVETIVKNNIQRVSNILGETYIKGMNDPSSILESDYDYIFNMNVSAVNKKQIIKNSTFTLRDNNGNILFENMIFSDPNYGNPTELYQESTVSVSALSQKFLVFKYTYNQFDTQYIKFLIGSKDIKDIAIWNESLPYKTVIPISDVNPPALDVTYLKNPVVYNSVFDINGIVKIDKSNNEVKFIKEIYNLTASGEYQSKGFNIETLEVTGKPTQHYGTVKTTITKYETTNIIYLNDSHTFVTGDLVYIKYNPYDNTITNPVSSGKTYTITEVNKTIGQSYIKLNSNLELSSSLLSGTKLSSEYTNILTKMLLATTSNMKLALKNSFYNVMINKTIPLSGSGSPTEGIYRQLFICYSPSDSNGQLCTLNTYNNDVTDLLFNKTTWSYDIGTLMYIANKITFYRKWATSGEKITIIL